MTPTRFSIIDYLNALPLNMAFKDGLFGGEADLVFDYPSQCADNLATGKADVGLISSIEYQRIPDLRIAPKICIASRRKVRSVLILTRKDLADVEVVALDRFSRSSVALLRILLHRRFGKRPKFITLSPDPQRMLRESDAALIIGDAALRLPEPDADYETMDLATAWFEETGLPFVFAFWVMTRERHASTIADILLRAKRYGLEQIPRRIPEIQARWALTEQEILSYFSENIHYDLGEQELQSLECFYSYAVEAGLIREITPLRFA